MAPQYWRSFAILLSLVLSANALAPEELTNFQDEYVCDTSVRIVMPLTHSDVEEAVKRHTHVMAMGVGHSYNNFLCAPPPEEDETSVNIVMTTIRPLKIEVNEEEMSVWVSAGVTVWDLADYIGNYNTESSPRGYTLPSGTSPLILNQTIAGAIATGTHGVSATIGSLSNLVMGFRVVLANGTTTEIYPDNYPLYFKAFQVNVGRLGVVTDVKMRIVKETVVTRSIDPRVPREDVMPVFLTAQETVKSTGLLPDDVDRVFYFWNPLNDTFLVYTMREAESQDAPIDPPCEGGTCAYLQELLERINAPLNVSRSEDGMEIADGVSWEAPEPQPPNPVQADPEQAEMVVAMNEVGTMEDIPAGTFETHFADVNSPDSAGPILRTQLHDHYEVSIPAEKLIGCIDGAFKLVETTEGDKGFRNIVFLRPNAQETGLLSIANDGPRVWMGFQDFVYYNQEVRATNVPMKRLVAYLLSSPLCAPARLHWGVAGWANPGCWHAAEYFKDTWCDFGCAVRDLDPYGKFIGNTPGVWNWNGANMDKCCTPDGYDRSQYGCDCAVVRQSHPEDCPAAPFFNNR